MSDIFVSNNFFQVFGPGFIIDQKDEKEIFSLFGKSSKINEKSKTENEIHTENDGIKKFLSWLELLATVNSKEKKMKNQKFKKPKDLLQSLYER